MFSGGSENRQAPRTAANPNHHADGRVARNAVSTS